ncbi:MAG: MBL fold metallo-hydrolase [Dehalococcoidia bacterium]
MAEIDTLKVAEGIHQIDTRCYDMPRFLASYLVVSDKIALIDSGPTTAVDNVLEGIRELGFAFKDIDYVVLTHIHLDHGGGAGTMLKELTNARVIVHDRGARHVIDPTRIIEGQIQFGGEDALRMDGYPIAVDADRVVAAADGDEIDLGGGRKLRLLHIPGHTRTAMAIYDEKTRGLFPGDSLGVYRTEIDVLIPAAPSPDFDLEVSLDSIKKMAGLPVDLILLAHFGASTKVAHIQELAPQRLSYWCRKVEGWMKEVSPEEVGRKLKADLVGDLEPLPDKGALYEYFTGDLAEMSANAIMGYLQRKSP